MAARSLKAYQVLHREAESRGLHVGLRSTSRARNAIAPDKPAPTVDAVQMVAKNGHVMAFRPVDGLRELNVASEYLLRQMGWKAAA